MGRLGGDAREQGHHASDQRIRVLVHEARRLDAVLCGVDQMPPVFLGAPRIMAVVVVVCVPAAAVAYVKKPNKSTACGCRLVTLPSCRVMKRSAAMRSSKRQLRSPFADEQRVKPVHAHIQLERDPNPRSRRTTSTWAVATNL